MKSLLFLFIFACTIQAQTPAITRADILRGEYGRYRSNNDLLSYHLDIRVDPAKKFISGRNAIRFKMLQADTRIQLELYANLQIEKILLGQTPLKYQREAHTVWVDFPQSLKAGRIYTIDFHYSGHPLEIGRFGGITFAGGVDPGMAGGVLAKGDAAEAADFERMAGIVEVDGVSAPGF